MWCLFIQITVLMMWISVLEKRIERLEKEKEAK